MAWRRRGDRFGSGRCAPSERVLRLACGRHHDVRAVTPSRPTCESCGQPGSKATEQGADMATPDAQRREQSIAEHVRGLSEESAGLVREQAQLIREDLIDELKRLGLGGVMLGGAGLLGLGAFATSTAGLVNALGGGKRGAAAVTVLYGAGAGGLAAAGREHLRKTAARAADTLGRDVQAAAEGVRQGA